MTRDQRQALTSISSEAWTSRDVDTNETPGPRPLNWQTLGAQIQQAAWVATSMHLVHSAGSPLDHGAVEDSPRMISGG